MKPLDITDIIGPIMVGPSSSHTAGALRIAQMVRNLLTGEPTKVTFTLYGSFSHTHSGHGTDKALVAGMLGLHTDDLRIKHSFDLAKKAGMDFTFVTDPDTKTPHPNTVDIEALDTAGNTVHVRGVSIGGGAAELTRIEDIDVSVTGEFTNMIVRQRDEPGALAHTADCLAQAGINIGSATMHRTHVGGEAYVVMDIDNIIPPEVVEKITSYPAITGVRVVPSENARPVQRKKKSAKGDSDALAKALEDFQRIDFASGAELLAYCEQNACPISEAFRAREIALLKSQGHDEQPLDAYLDRALDVMRTSATTPLTEPVPSLGGLIGGESSKLIGYANSLKNPGRKEGVHPHDAGFSFGLARFCAYALAVLETNASMGCIVAAPTAGSSGVLPAVLFALQDEYGFDDDDLKRAILNASALGDMFMRNATVAGAEGGCQAEVGAASAMAASAAAELLGATPAQCLDAAGMAVANLLGLVCDPVGGLVETPCQKRNATGAINAYLSAQMAVAGISNLAPFDEMADALLRTGRAIPYELRETALGGMATCPTCVKAVSQGSCHAHV